MLPTRSTWALAIPTLALITASAHAEAVTPAPVEVTILETVSLPWQAPEVIVTTQAPLDEMHVEVSIDGVKGPEQTLQDLAASSTRTLSFQAAIGAHDCVVLVTGISQAGAFAKTWSSKIHVVPALEVAFKPADVNLAARKLSFSASSDVAFAELSIFDMDGRSLHQSSTRADADVPGKPIQLTWPQLTAAAAKISLRVFSTTDTWADAEWSPIQIEIPHEPIYFDDVFPSAARTEKLDAAYAAIRGSVREHAGVPGLKLYVLGLTRDDATLSDATDRAKSVASYLRSRGIALPILASGSSEAGAEAGSGYVQAILAVDEPTQSEWVAISGKSKLR